MPPLFPTPTPNLIHLPHYVKDFLSHPPTLPPDPPQIPPLDRNSPPRRRDMGTKKARARSPGFHSFLESDRSAYCCCARLMRASTFSNHFDVASFSCGTSFFTLPAWTKWVCAAAK